jgi:sialate O-acetylesterase
MQWAVSQSADPQQTIASADHPQIRLFTVPRQAAPEPQSDVLGNWNVCSPQTIPTFSAVAYHFGQALQKELDVPIGLINTSFGGTPAEAWTSRQGLAEHQSLQHYVARPADPKNKNGATGLYNAMIHPLVPFAIRGAIWYQGESNAGRAFEYRTLFPAMITDWRRVWGQGDFPFLFVQLAPFKPIVDQPVESDWAELREAQLYTAQSVPKTAMAVITDVGDEKDIHPKQKQPVGERLALAARALAYGEQKLVFSGPEFKEAKVDAGKMVLSFKHVGDGLAAKGDSLTGFTIAGSDRKFVNAYAEIRNDQVVVWHPEVSQPVAVRYGWANYPTGNLWNTGGLPATPFRTDDFPMITAPKK